jgi:hypothetical protein
MPAACELSPAIREFLGSLPPGTVLAQLDDGSLAVCQSEDEADRLIVASRRGPAKDGKPTRKHRSTEPGRASKQLSAG